MKNRFSRHHLKPVSERRSSGKAVISRFWKGFIGIAIGLLFLFCLWVYSILGAFRPFFWDGFSLIGFGGTKTYLVLLQNENELRPTGGFLTSFGILRMRFGIPSLQFYNSEDVAVPQPEITAPGAIERVMSRDPKYAGWVFRDSNFDLDFAVNARRALAFLQRDERFQDVDFDGVIAADTTLLADMVDFLGPVELEGKKVTGENLFETLEFSAKNFDHHDLEDWKNRKNALVPLTEQILGRAKWKMFTSDGFFERLAKNSEEKHLLFFFPDAELQERFREKGWSGELPPGVWTVNFANLGGRKGDRFLRREFSSSFHVDETGKVEERFTMFLRHEGTYNLQSDRYEVFVRIVRPPGMTLVGSEGEFETAPETTSSSDTLETSFFVALVPGEEKLLAFTFAFPEEFQFVPGNTLAIPLVKQPGTDGIDWNFTFRGENDVRFAVKGCDEARSRENVFFCDIALNRDRGLAVSLQPDTTPPLLQFANFTGGNDLEVRFSEDIVPELGTADVTIAPVDQPEETAQPAAIRIEGENVFLSFSGLSAQKGDRFRLQIRNLADLSGNKFAGAEAGLFAVTVVNE